MRPGGCCERIDNPSLMKTRTIEVIIADKCEGPVDPDRVIAGSISPPDAPEVAGRSESKKEGLVKCTYCGAFYYVCQINGNLTRCPYCGYVVYF